MTKSRVVGVSYGPDESSPTIILKGAGTDADAIVAAAKLRETPIVRAPELAEHLYRSRLDAPVGRELFPVMALLLAHVMQADRTQKESAGE